MHFPKETLEVVSLDKTDSAFSFWLEEPNFSNNEGTLSFIGGTPYGVSGGSIQVLKIVFLTKGSGSGIITISDTAITASDGSGTNILSKTVDASFAVVPKKETPPIPSSATTTVSVPAQAVLAPIPVPAPIQISRKSVPTGKLPVKPLVKVPLYPDETKWYNLTSQFNVSWDLTADVTGVGTAINRQPNFAPAKSEGLFNNKAFAALSNGVWYLHVRFQNDLGWGAPTHYRLAIDTVPPLGFEVSAVEGAATDSPTPTIQFKTSDALSGLKEYQIRVGDGESTKISATDFKGSFRLSLRSPGKRRIAVKAVDWADNGIEDSITLETIPITSPIITFVTKELFFDEERGLAVKGTALPAASILLRVYRKEALVVDGIARADEKGNWEFNFNQAFKNGDYKVTAQSQDTRGALSLVVSSSPIRVKSKPLVQLGAFQLEKGGVTLLLLLVIILGLGGGIWFYKKRQKKLTMRVSFAELEITKIFQLIRADVEHLAKARETAVIGDDEYALKRLREDIEKMETYLKKGVEKIKK